MSNVTPQQALLDFDFVPRAAYADGPEVNVRAFVIPADAGERLLPLIRDGVRDAADLQRLIRQACEFDVSSEALVAVLDEAYDVIADADADDLRAQAREDKE